MERHRMITAAAVLGLVVALLVACGSKAPEAAPISSDCLLGGQRPCSGQVETGKPYRFQVEHCGLVFAVDFDGSYWDVDKASMTADEDQRFGINSDVGTMTLEKEDTAVYRSERGGEATLHRHEGAPKFSFCA